MKRLILSLLFVLCFVPLVYAFPPSAPSGSSGDVEGTSIKSTGEAGGTKFLREDGDGTSSWQEVSGTGDITSIGDCSTGNCFVSGAASGTIQYFWNPGGTFWTALQGGAVLANRSWRLPIDAPPGAGLTEFLSIDEYGQMIMSTYAEVKATLDLENSDILAAAPAVTLNASATTGGMSISGQEISFRAATNAQTGYATAAHVAAIEAATAAKHTQGTDTALGTLGTKNPMADADKLVYRNSEATDALVTSTFTQLKAFLKTYFDTLYQAASANLTTWASIAPSANVQTLNGAANYQAFLDLLLANGTFGPIVLEGATADNYEATIAVDDPKIDQTIILKYGKYDATAAPGVTNDLDEGYQVGSIWVDVTHDNVYVCLDKSNDAAVWAQIDDAGGTVASSAEINSGTDNDKFISPDALAGSNAFTKEVAWTIKDSDANIAIADGKQAFAVPASMNGMNLVDVTASVADLNSASGGATTIVIRRVRGATAADMTSTGVTIDYNAYTASDETVDTSNDDIATGDKIYVDVNGTTTGAVQKGLSVTALFRLP